MTRETRLTPNTGASSNHETGLDLGAYQEKSSEEQLRTLGGERLRSVKLLSERGHLRYTGLRVACEDSVQLDALPSVMRPKSNIIDESSHISQETMLSFDEFQSLQELHEGGRLQKAVGHMDAQKFQSLLEHIRQEQLELTKAMDSKAGESSGAAHHLDAIAQYKMQIIKEAIALSQGGSVDTIAEDPKHALAQDADSITFTDKKNTSPPKNPLQRKHGDYLDKLAKEQEHTAQTEAQSSERTRDMGFDLTDIDTSVHPLSSDASSVASAGMRAKGEKRDDTGPESVLNFTESETPVDMGLEGIQSVPDQDPHTLPDKETLPPKEQRENSPKQEAREDKEKPEQMKIDLVKTVEFLEATEVQVALTPEKVRSKIGARVEELAQSIMAIVEEKRFTLENVDRAVQSLKSLDHAIAMIPVNAQKNNIVMKKPLENSLHKLAILSSTALNEGMQLHEMLKPDSGITADAKSFKTAYAKLIHQLAEGFNF